MNLAQQIACMEANPDVVIPGHKVIAVDSQGEQLGYRSRNPFAGMPQERDFDAHAGRTLERVIPTSCRVFRNIQIDLPLECDQNNCRRCLFTSDACGR